MANMIVAGNWKMNASAISTVNLLRNLTVGVKKLTANVKIVVFPPSPYLFQAKQLLQGSAITLGAQDVSEHRQGAYTGEVSVDMLNDFGVHYVLVGHSERRSLYAESNALVASKFQAVKACGMVPILCVGETLKQREDIETLNVVNNQVQAVVDKLGIDALATAVLAYEPVWAIGTGLTASPQQVKEVHQGIRAHVAKQDAILAERMKILYGGSVNSSVAAKLFSQADIDGVLVGSASLDAQSFLAISHAAQF